VKSYAAGLLVCLTFVTSTVAGPKTDTLSKCLVESSTRADRTVLLRWIVAAATTHPEVADMAAIAADGPLAIEKSFELLGQVAGEELFMSPDVQKSMAGIEKYIDAEKLTDALVAAPET
jgi:hypothetical protein